MGGGGEKEVYTLSEVKNHSSREDCWLIINGKVYDVTKFLEDHPGGDEDCWLIINGKVYDVTKFLEDHPGGDEVLLAVTGKDATDDFEDVGHSSTARAMMEEYYVGEINASTIPTKVAYAPPKQAHYNQDKTWDFVIKILQFLVPLAILGLAVAVRFYTKSP
ncbi:hypothetical protein HPP92_021373 [Vanilla planifolia]|uniref:Cytochrome b5 heme-binding domain-containing protein n=1 Tax=Vanilla planifolia TaxID=51239 RepID=A0A835PVA4_VANPL|nr:hypothetical protein HPP92_021373 [Vanilla planifolia]